MLLLVALAPSSAFLVSPALYQAGSSTTTALAASDVTKKVQFWNGLKGKQQNVLVDTIIQESEKGTSQEEIANKLVEQMVSAAVDYAKQNVPSEAEDDPYEPKYALEDLQKRQALLEKRLRQGFRPGRK